MDSYKKRNRRHSNHYNYQPSYCDDKSSPRETFDSNCTRSSKSNSESPNSHRPISQSTFECRLCLNTYESSKELYAHLLAEQHFKPLSRLPEEEDKFPFRKRKCHGIYCKVCFGEFNTHNELKKHLSESGHHWIAKRARPMSNHDKSAYEHKAYSDRRRHSSSTDARSDRSFPGQNRDLIDVEESRRKDPIPYVQSYGFSVRLDESVSVQEKDIDILDGDNSGLSKVDGTNVKVPLNSSSFGIDQYCQSIITSPDDSILVSSKIPIELSTSNGQKEMAVPIPMEPSIPTIDPRQNCPHERPESHRPESRNLTTKWAPIYCDRPKPNLAEKRIPWKLIPIDISPSNYPDNSFSNSRTLIPGVPSPTEDVLDVSIDQLAAQLKENTGATFIPNLRMESNVSHSHVSFEGNILNCFNRKVLSTYPNTSEERAPLQSSLHSPVSCQDGTRGGERHNVIAETVTVEESDGEDFDGTLARTGELIVKEHRQFNSSSCSPSSPNVNVSSTEVSRLPCKVMPTLIPRPVIDHQVDAEILEALGSMNSTRNTQILITPIQSSSTQVLFSKDTEKMDAPQSPVFVDKDISQNVTLSLIAEKDMSIVESCLFQISDESVGEVANIYYSENSSISLSNAIDKSVTTKEVIDSCPSCQTLLNIRCLKIDLKTGNASITCLGCDVHIVMANVFKKVL